MLSSISNQTSHVLKEFPVIRRRLSVALVAATSTALALVTPVHAGEPGQDSNSLSSTSSLSSSSEEDTTGLNGAGGQLPGWAGSLEMSPESELAIEIVKAVMAVGLAATQAAVIVLPLMPGGVDQLRAFLAQFGIQG